MMVGVAPLTTLRPWVTTRRTSFGARVLSVSFKSAAFVSPSAPSVGAVKRRTLGRPGPQVGVLPMS